MRRYAATHILRADGRATLDVPYVENAVLILVLLAAEHRITHDTQRAFCMIGCITMEGGVVVNGEQVPAGPLLTELFQAVKQRLFVLRRGGAHVN